eukprot:12472-Chlamydomonas_euryale.AAC.1
MVNTNRRSTQADNPQSRQSNHINDPLARLWGSAIESHKRKSWGAGSIHLSRYSVLSLPGRKVRKTSQWQCGAVV